MTDDMILQLAAIVAAYVGVGKTLGINPKYSPLIAIAIAAVFVLVPDSMQKTITSISVIGLTASGAYSYVKNSDGGKSNGKGI
ncbi:hypothetical protein [Paenibacillus rigui]|uniref:Holin n=1 Tax=Paenibacillus rigui TaxID=554312 RepID=A0A229UNZ4_9BACL|nr:hypothetical protein [Paenibacillus rigui]OXM84619.1 hypothetical protein CF651_19120 [Paenibacillus rigui]